MVTRRTRDLALALLALGMLLGTPGCGDDDSLTSTGSRSASVIVFNAELEDLNAYDPLDSNRKQVVISGNETEADPNQPAVNGQICFDPSGSRQLVLGDDAGQPNPPPGWSILQLRGSRVGELSATRVARLIPTYQGGPESGDNYGCGFLRDGRLVTSDLGNAESGPATGQIIVWFPPFGFGNNHYCKIDIAVATPGGIFIDNQDRIYVSSARLDAGIFRYTGPFPTSDTQAGGCGRLDPTGAPMADVVERTKFVPADGNIPTPNAIVGSGHGTFYVSSILNGVIAEYDAGGKFVQRVLQPPTGEHLGTEPYSTGTPLGLQVDSTGTLYYADLGLVMEAGGFGPGSGKGSVRRIRFENGAPLSPETIDSGLSFPDGIGVLEP